MATLAKARVPRKPQPRSVAVISEPTVCDPRALIRIKAGNLAVTYWLTKITSAWGDAFRLEKAGPEEYPDVYHVNLDANGHTCDCYGAAKWGHCKHVDALLKLCEMGRI